MAKQPKTRVRAEFGDFQTPLTLAFSVTELLRQLGIDPSAVLEPSCGHGSFLSAAAQSFPGAATIIGVEINPHHVESAAASLTHVDPSRLQILQGDFFSFDWPTIFKKSEGPWLVLGNPPWVTNSRLSAFESNNLPAKSNSHGRAGIEAVTGKSNFDISEWMLLKYIEWLKSSGTIAVLCKTSVARKVISHAWRKHTVSSSRIYKINAMESFGAAVDACLLIIELASTSGPSTCDVFASISDTEPLETITLHNGHLVASTSNRVDSEALWGPEVHYIWRSGIKHDCSRVMELFCGDERRVNGLGEHVEIEGDFLYPMLKGSDIGNGRIRPRALMIVPQKNVGEDTAQIASKAPHMWDYLQRHRSLLDNRASIIYKNRPQFSIFGVGPYTFAPWKIAVSSFYKKLLFVPVGPVRGRTVVFDDTVYFLPCSSEEEAEFLVELLGSQPACDFLSSMIHWSDKRPLTIELLKRLSIQKLARFLGREHEYDSFVSAKETRCVKQMSFAYEASIGLLPDESLVR